MDGPDQLETRTGIPTPETEPPFSVSCFKTYKLLLYMGTYVESSREHVKTTPGHKDQVRGCLDYVSINLLVWVANDAASVKRLKYVFFQIHYYTAENLHAFPY